MMNMREYVTVKNTESNLRLSLNIQLCLGGGRESVDYLKTTRRNKTKQNKRSRVTVAVWHGLD